MLSQKLAIGGKEQHRAVESPQRSFDHADDEVQLIAARDLANLLGRWPGHGDRAVEILAKLFSPFVRADAQTDSELTSFGISPEKGFGEYG